MVKPCPKCGAGLSLVPADGRAPEHISCRMCGFCLERPVVVVMPEIPPIDNPYLTAGVKLNLTPEQRRERWREAGRRYRAKLKGNEAGL